MSASFSDGQGATPQPRALRRDGTRLAPTVRKPVAKRYGAKAKYSKAPGETAYERRRREKP